jgi:S-formylglutathione hydrolase FrmB
MRTLILFILCCCGLCAASQVRVYVHLDTAIHHTITGTLYLYTSTDTLQGVPNEPDMAHPEPMYRKHVSRWHPGRAPQVFDDAAAHFSQRLSELKPGVYALAAIVDLLPGQWGNQNKGNWYARKKILLTIDSNGRGEAHITLDRMLNVSFRDNDSVRLVELPSKLLSAFRKKEIKMQAAVYLPHGFDSAAAQTYPVVYIIPGWGGTHYDAMSGAPAQRYGIGKGLPKIYVLLNPETETPYGLHAFVDSRVNGPWGRALVDEMLPYIRWRFKGSPDPQQTFVMGQSSGGYPSLWLPLHYPDSFGGGWAVSPDPVDFSDFTGVQMYQPGANYYSDSTGKLIPFFLWKDKYESTLKTIQAIEDFQEMGGQTQSFEAEFGEPGYDGKPVPLFNRKTGAIDSKVVQSWRPYDLGIFVLENWAQLAPKLSGGKLHVYAGANDNFGLDRAVTAFARKAKQVNADIVTELIPNANHWTIWSAAFTERVQREIDALVMKAKKK